MDTITQPDILKQGVLGKLGGGAGGHKNWKDRYFVLSDHLYYYNSKEVRQTHWSVVSVQLATVVSCVFLPRNRTAWVRADRPARKRSAAASAVRVIQ